MGLESLRGDCLADYGALQKYLVAQAIFMVTQIVLQILVVTKPFAGVGVCIVGLLENIVSFYIFYVCVLGMSLVLFKDKAEEIQKCEKLHNTAWWYFAGLPLISLALLCCSCAAFAGAVLAAGSSRQANGRENNQNAAAVAPIVEEVAYKALEGREIA